MAVALAALAAPYSARAEDWPSRPIKVIVPAGPGSAVDVVPRAVFDQLSAVLGQPIVVENKPGAGTMVGTAQVARAEPDGYMLLATSPAHAVTPWVYTSSITYDIQRDFVGIGAFGVGPTVLIVSPKKGYKTAADLVAAAKAAPGMVTFSSIGIGSGVHVSAEKFRLSAGIDVLHVPYKSGPEALTSVVTGQVDFYLCPIGTALPFIKDGRVLALAVNGRERSSLLPEVPTTLELGYKGSDYPQWFGMFAPAKTPPAIVEKLADALKKALATDVVKARMVTLGLDPMPLSPKDFDAYVADEFKANKAVVEAAHITPN